MAINTNPQVTGVPLGPGLDASGNPTTLTASIAWNPPMLAAGSEQLLNVPLSGAAMGDAVVAVSFSIDQQGTNLAGYVSAPGVVTVTHNNDTEVDLDLGPGTIRVWVNKSF